jgi:hypothetical protein
MERPYSPAKILYMLCKFKVMEMAVSYKNNGKKKNNEKTASERKYTEKRKKEEEIKETIKEVKEFEREIKIQKFPLSLEHLSPLVFLGIWCCHIKWYKRK